MSLARPLLGVAAMVAVVALLATACSEATTTSPPAGSAPAKPATATGTVAAAPAGTPQATCPVMGGAINKKFYADHQGKRVYFCCPGCDAAFKKDPDKYIKKLEDQGVTLATTPAGEARP